MDTDITLQTTGNLVLSPTGHLVINGTNGVTKTCTSLPTVVNGIVTGC